MLQIPKNVMQIGEISAHTKIYMEDYVHTFVEKIRDAQTYLVFGRKEERNDVMIYLIYGVEKKTDWDRGSYPYFKKYDRLGTLERMDGKSVFKPIRGSGIVLSGYFIFYEQNEDMQSYMIAARETEGMSLCGDTDKVIEEVAQRREARRQEREASAVRAGSAQRGAAKIKTTKKLFAAGTFAERKTDRALKRKNTESRASVQGRAERTAPASSQSHRWTIPELCRVGCLAMLLVLFATALTSVNRYPDMKAVMEIFSQAAENVRGDNKSDSQNSSLVVEEENAGTALAEERKPESEEAIAGEEAAAEAETAFGTASGTEMISGSESGAKSEKAAENAASSLEEALPAAGQAAAVNSALPENGEKNESETVSSDAGPASYIVKKGDNLAQIIRNHYGTTARLWEICELNNIKDPDQILPGQNILLP